MAMSKKTLICCNPAIIRVWLLIVEFVPREIKYSHHYLDFIISYSKYSGELNLISSFTEWLHLMQQYRKTKRS